MAKKFSVEDIEGYQQVVTPENSDLGKINFSVLRKGEKSEYKGMTDGNETVFVLTEGRMRFFTGSQLTAEMSRRNVFSEPPTAVYLPPYTSYSIEFIDKTEVCLASCKARGLQKARLIESSDMTFSRKGEDGYFRNLTEIMNQDFPSEKIIVGETISDPGSWVSYPPHKHDTDNHPEEVSMEELYFFKVNPRTGFGMMRVFSDASDDVFVVRNNVLVTIPGGYHPISVAPGHQVYYLWIMAGENKKMVPYIHPDFRFVGK